VDATYTNIREIKQHRSMISSGGDSKHTVLKMKNRITFLLQNIIPFSKRETGTCIYINKTKGEGITTRDTIIIFDVDNHLDLKLLYKVNS